MAYPISPDYDDLVGYLLTRIPQYGILYLNDQPLHVGDRFSERDLTAGLVRYQQTENLPYGATTVQDSFNFRLFDRGLIVSSASQYVSCLPDRDIPVPSDGIYTFPITIRATPTPIGVARNIVLKQGATRPITNLDLNIAGAASSTSQIVHTVTRAPTQGSVLLNGRSVNQFTQEDVNSGRISYAHNGGTAGDQLVLRSCNQFSKCVRNTLSVSFDPTVSFVGDNVFYGKIGTKWQAQLGASKELLLWDLIGTTPVGPPLSPVAIGVVYWTYYDANRTGAANSPDRGAGYDKLPLYRNVPLRYQWGGGLPTGVYVDNMTGLVSTASRVPYDPLNDVTWVLPLVPDEFHWRVQITDPYTGESAVRDFVLRVTETGTGASGQTSETL